MLLYRIVFTFNAKKSIVKLPITVQDRIDKTLLRIIVRPYDFIERMVNYPFFKLRIGEYRLILDVRDQDLIILVVEGGHRRNIYKRFKQ